MVGWLHHSALSTNHGAGSRLRVSTVLAEGPAGQSAEMGSLLLREGLLEPDLPTAVHSEGTAPERCLPRQHQNHCTTVKEPSYA